MPALAAAERQLVRYDRLTAGDLAWLRVSVADLPDTTPLKDYVSAQSPGSAWKREADAESLTVSGQNAARIAFTGTWNGQQYISETVAVRHGDQVYFLTASFPAADADAREKARQAIAAATWPK